MATISCAVRSIANFIGFIGPSHAAGGGATSSSCNPAAAPESNRRVSVPASGTGAHSEQRTQGWAPRHLSSVWGVDGEPKEKSRRPRREFRNTIVLLWALDTRPLVGVASPLDYVPGFI